MKIELKPITAHNELILIKEIYEKSFPSDERRHFENLTHQLKNKLFYPNFILSDGNISGLFFYWDFKEFRYLEHFAVDEKLRGNGIGRKVMIDFIDKSQYSVLLEAEKPESELSIKRLRFYTGLGFDVVDYKYVQPPYEKGKNPVEMYLLSTPKINDTLRLSDFVGKIYQNVYNYKDYRMDN
jgi:GNAT superfamily N-acetyltransferase